MAKSIKQIADELGVDKQKVYRYIVTHHINEIHHEAHRKNGTKYYDEVAETLIKQGFLNDDIHHEAHHEAHQKSTLSASNDVESVSNEVLLMQFEMMKKMVEDKDAEIKRLNAKIENLNKEYIDKIESLHNDYRCEIADLRKNHHDQIMGLEYVASKLEPKVLEKKQEEVVEQPEPQPEEKKSFWARLFKF